MNSLIVPDWVKQELQTIGQRNDRQERDRVERLLLQKSMKADGLEYRKELARWIALGVECCESLGLTGTSEEIREDEKSVGVRFTLTIRGLPNRSRSTNVFFRDDEPMIRCFSETEKEEQFNFCTDENGDLRLRVKSSAVSAQKSADFFVQREYRRLTSA